VRILILKVQTIGDTLLITPLIKNLFHYFKQPKIDVVVNQGTSDMLTFNPNVNKILYTQEKRLEIRQNYNVSEASINLLK